MATLMQRLLHVDTRAVDYTQGEDLFAPTRKHNWLALGDSNELVIVTPKETVILDKDGHYRTYDADNEEMKGEKPQLALLLQVLTDVKRFIAN